MRGETERGIHVAIIMDGNGRWADRLRLPLVAEHRAGVAGVRRVVEHAADICIGRLTLYAFSSDNWRRPPAEVQSIFWLLRAFLRLETERMRQRGVRLRFIGRRDRLDHTVLKAMESAERVTAAGSYLSAWRSITRRGMRLGVRRWMWRVACRVTGYHLLNLAQDWQERSPRRRKMWSWVRPLPGARPTTKHNQGLPQHLQDSSARIA